MWLHFNVADLRARHWLETRATLQKPPCASCWKLTRRSGFAAAEGFLLVVGDLRHDFHADPEGFGQLRIYLDGTRMITTRCGAPDRRRLRRR